MGSRRQLIALLRSAYSGERAAALAYAGHARSVRDPEEKRRLLEIEQDEWLHRKQVGEMLRSFGAGPLAGKEWLAGFVGHSLGVLCHLAGWFLPMYAAGKLETGNVQDYETAARLAAQCGRSDLVPRLLEMAKMEQEHERFFHDRLIKPTRRTGDTPTSPTSPSPRRS